MTESAEKTETRGFDSYPVKLGDLMRGERATLGKSLLDVQRDLRVKAAYIAAIENTDPSAFQTPGFISGYVRSYARYLNLDPEETFAQFCAESGFDGVHPGMSNASKTKAKTKPVSEPAKLSSNLSGSTQSKPAFEKVTVLKSSNAIPVVKGPFNSVNEGVLSQISFSGLGSVMVLMMLIVGIGYGGWSVVQDIQRVEFSPVGETTDVVADAPIGVDSSQEQAALEQLYRPKELEVPIMTPRDGPIAALDPNAIGALVQNNGGQMAEETAKLVEAEAPKVTAPAAPLVAVVARKPAWIRVSLMDGTILFERILNGGESFQLPKGAVSTLRSGNSGEVFLSVENKLYGPIGEDNSVSKGVELSPKSILASYAAVSDPAALQSLGSPRVITLNSTGQ